VVSVVVLAAVESGAVVDDAKLTREVEETIVAGAGVLVAAVRISVALEVCMMATVLGLAVDDELNFAAG